MKLLKKLKGAWLHQRSASAKASLLGGSTHESIDLEDFSLSLKDPTAYYERAFQEFHRHLPKQIREHREYFQSNQRGFGEDAFHAMWWHLMGRFKPANFLEIGIYRGQTISLVSLISKIEGIPCETHGISPFSSAGDSVSNYLREIDYLEDTLQNFRHFSLPEPDLLKAYSTDEVAVEKIRGTNWDCIYIDGNHDYDVVQKDWEVCSQSLAPAGIVVLDDSGLTTEYNPPRFATGGHPGPSRLASEIDSTTFTEILQVGHNRVFQKAGA